MRCPLKVKAEKRKSSRGEAVTRHSVAIGTSGPGADGGALAASGWMQTPQGEWTVTPMISGNGLKIPGA